MSFFFQEVLLYINTVGYFFFSNFFRSSLCLVIHCIADSSCLPNSVLTPSLKRNLNSSSLFSFIVFSISCKCITRSSSHCLGDLKCSREKEETISIKIIIIFIFFALTPGLIVHAQHLQRSPWVLS